MAKNKKTTSRPQSGLPFPPWVLGLAALVLVVGGFLFWQNVLAAAPAKSGFPAEISVAEALAQRSNGAFMLDVREPSEWNEYHMPGATLIPLAELPRRLSEVPRDQPIVVVCRSGNRSQQGRDVLLANGFTNVTSMAGGMSDWRNAGYEVATGP